MAGNDADEAKASASLARLRLFLSSHAPNGQEKAPMTSLDPNPRTFDDETPGVPSEQKVNAVSDAEITEEENGGQTTIPAAGVVASVAPLSQSSKEFERVKYLLQCSLPGFRVHENVVIHDMQNPLLVAQYEQYSTGLLELDSWVAVNDLGNDVADIHSYGFTSLDATQPNMKFTTGNLQFSAPLDQSADVQKAASTRQLVLCKIAVGRSLVIHDEKDVQARLPAGYHSYYVHQDASGTQDQALLDRGYYHEYILTNTLQILPQYLVRFTFSAADHKVAVASCALCEQHSAVVICRNCEAELCAQCDHDVHSANKLVRRHKRTPLRSKARAQASEGARRGRRRSSTPSLENGAANSEPTGVMVDEIVAKQIEENLLADEAKIPWCQSHGTKKVEFYCPVCHVAVCVSCKMVGDHSIGEKGSHRLVSVANAYENCLRESLRPDSLITSRKSVIENKLQLISCLQQSILANKAQVATAIQDQCARALHDLNDAVAIKMQVLSGEMLEFERQLQQIDWVDESLEDHRTLFPAVEFLSAWNQHKVLRAQQREFPPFAHHNVEPVKADLHLAGDLQIIVAEQLATLPPPLLSPNATDPIFESNQENPTCQSECTQSELRAAAIFAQHRRSGDDLRTQLLTMKPTLLPKSNADFFMTPRRVVSPKCQQLLDEIHHEILVQNSAKKAAMSPRSPMSPRSGFGKAATRAFDFSAPLRASFVQPSGQKAPDELQSPRQCGISAWSTLLRHEMGLSDS